MAIAFARQLVSPERRGAVSLAVFALLSCNLYHVYFTTIPKTYAVGALFVMAGFLLLVGQCADSHIVNALHFELCFVDIHSRCCRTEPGQRLVGIEYTCDKQDTYDTEEHQVGTQSGEQQDTECDQHRDNGNPSIDTES